MIGCLELAQAIYGIFGLDLRIELSTRPEKRIGGDELWDAPRRRCTRRSRGPGWSTS